MKTELLYLENTYKFTETATFVEMRENERGKAVILDRTIFYPQGGGQPSDTGTIKGSSGVFKVTFVGLDPDGTVWHFGEFESGSFSEGETVELSIDEEKRRLHAQIHSAGHLIDVATTLLNIPIKATKGFHFPDGPYVEYEGGVEDAEALKTMLQEKMDTLIAQHIPVCRENITSEEAVAKGMMAPVGKGYRTIGFESHDPCGCGGTHVENSSEIGGVTIRKISSKKGVTRVSYSVN